MLGTNAPALTLNDLGANVGLPLGDTITLISYSGSWDGNFFSVGGTPLLDGGAFAYQAYTFQISYNTGSNVVLTVIPEPNAFASLSR